jgi:hypothetical protein
LKRDVNVFQYGLHRQNTSRADHIFNEKNIAGFFIHDYFLFSLTFRLEVRECKIYLIDREICEDKDSCYEDNLIYARKLPRRPHSQGKINNRTDYPAQ